MINRRKMFRGMAATAVTAPLFPGLIQAAPAKKKLKRVIFFLQNQGFDPYTAIPKDLKEAASLDSFDFQEPIKALEPLKDKIHIINGLHGLHTSPSHSAFFGALGGYRGGIGSPPRGATIDHVISQHLPETILPHLCIGMDSLPNMQSRPTLATLSATGP